MPLKPLELLRSRAPLLAATLLVAGCAASAEHEAKVAGLEEAVREERRLRENEVAKLRQDAAALQDALEATRRELHRRERELQAQRDTHLEESRALEATLALIKQLEGELAELRAQVAEAPPTADEAVALLKAKDKELRALRERLIALQSDDVAPPDPALEGIVTPSGVDLLQPVARIDGRPITRREFVEFLYRDLGAPHLLDLFLNRQLVLQEAKRRGITVSDVDVEMWVSRQALDELERAGSEERLSERLAELGFTREAWKARLRYQATPSLLLQRLVEQQRQTPAGKAAFEARVRAAYKELYTERVVANHVFVRLAHDAPEAEERAALAKAEAAYRELARGVELAQVARTYSEDAASRQLGGQLGTIDRRRFRELPQLNTVLFTIEVGQVSRPVRSAAGYHVVRVDKRLPPERPFDAELRRELIARLEQEPPSDEELEVLMDRLRSRARIETSLTFE